MSLLQAAHQNEQIKGKNKDKDMMKTKGRHNMLSPKKTLIQQDPCVISDTKPARLYRMINWGFLDHLKKIFREKHMAQQTFKFESFHVFHDLLHSEFYVI